MTITPEQLAAYADGQLEGEERLRVAKAVLNDPALAAEIEKHKALKAKLGAHFAPIAQQPVPDHLAAMLQPKTEEYAAGGADVVSFAAERQKRGLVPMVRRFAPVGIPAIAAALALAVFVPTGDAPNAPYADSQLAAALDTQLVSDQGDAATRVLLSFQNDAGEFCRAYRGEEAGGIACRDENGWQLEQQFALDGAQSTEFRQAGSEADLLAAAQDMAASGALDAEAEAAARDNAWQN